MKRLWGSNIRTQRLTCGLSQKQLADAVGVEQSTVSKWESGRKAPTVEHQLAIAHALRVNGHLLFVYPEAA